VYLRFGGMIATSVVAMYGLTYVNTFSVDHLAWSETRVYMAVLMGSAMAAIMLTWMLGMHRLWRINAAIYAGSAAVFVLALVLVRSQATVGDVSYMKAMIPHHSIAVLTSRRARIEDVRVRALADQIIETQLREIAEMKALIAELEAK